ncbi:MAG: hypothetical protein Q8R24_07495 [Legionellaceae bacterium]|nr:hypothetical protein [Legionellaceae bacterium]
MDLPKTTTGLEKKERLTMAEKLQQFEANLSRGMSQRRASNDVGIARGTLLDWKDRVESIPLSKLTVY